MSDNEIYLLIKYIKSVLWRVAKRLSYIEDARCLNFNANWSNSGVLCESRTKSTPPRTSPRCKYVPWILISCDVLPRGDNIDPPPQPLYSRPTASLWLLVTSQGIYISSSRSDVE